jgi:mannose-6-phosphate isomerase-like protein (cupin superfamily)
MEKIEIENPERRRFLRAMPIAAAAGLALSDASLFTAHASAQSSMQKGSSTDAKFQVIDGGQVEDAIRNLQADPGNKTLYESKTLTWVLTCEKAKSAKEFEWHEQRDHIFHILDGSTTYELGGTPQNAHSKGPGEWLAPSSEGATTITLSKGEFLVIPRGTPHRRTTKDSVTFALISPQTA